MGKGASIVTLMNKPRPVSGSLDTQVVIPVPGALPGTLRTHTVQSGETLQSIAGMHGTSWVNLWTANAGLLGGISPRLRPGQTLTIPG